MDGDKVLCSFSGEWICKADAFEIQLEIPGGQGEFQTFYVKKPVFLSHVLDKVPIHPNFLD